VLLLVAGQRRELVDRRLTAVLDLELADETPELGAPLVHVCGYADCAALVRDRTLARLPGVGRSTSFWSITSQATPDGVVTTGGVIRTGISAPVNTVR
jgi:hypothetical protein